MRGRNLNSRNRELHLDFRSITQNQYAESTDETEEVSHDSLTVPAGKKNPRNV